MASIGGRTYGTVLHYTTYALLYNEKLLGAAGITKPPSTPQEFLSAAQRLTKAPEQFGYGVRHSMNEEVGWWYELVPISGRDDTYSIRIRALSGCHETHVPTPLGPTSAGMPIGTVFCRRMRTLTVGLSVFRGIYASEWTQLMAGSLMVMLPLAL